MSENVSRVTDRFSGNIEQQIALKRAGRRKLVRHGGTLCSGCYAEPPLPGQRYGAECHRKAVSASYHRRQEELRRLRTLEQHIGTIHDEA